MRVDVADRSRVDEMVAAALDRWGRIDILSANAGVYPAAALGEIDAELLERVLAINVKGAIYSMQACLPTMRDRGYGRMVLTSSITGPLVGAAGYGTYGATKAALLGFMRSAALELGDHGITINAVQPGNVRTRASRICRPNGNSR